MKNTGHTRKIDDTGRIVIPKALRTTLKLEVGDEVEFLIDEASNILGLKAYQASTTVDDFIEAIDNFMESSASQEVDEILKTLREKLLTQ